MTVAELVQEYIAARLAGQEVAKITADGMRCTLEGFARSIGDPDVAELSSASIEEWRRHVHLAASTLRTQFSQVRTFCRWACVHGYIGADPTLALRAPRTPRSVPRGLRLREVESLIAACPDSRARLCVMFMTQEGLRRKEVVGLNFGDIDLDEAVMLVRGKGGHERVLPISSETMGALDEYLGEHPAVSGPLIRSYWDDRAGISATWLGHLVVDWMRLAGIKQSARDGRGCHSMRHTMATDMLRSGAHLRDVQAALGHAHLNSTEVYLPWLVGDLRRAMGGRWYRKGLAEHRADESA